MNWQLVDTEGKNYFQCELNDTLAIYATRSGNELCHELFKPILLKQTHSDTIVDVDSEALRVGDGLVSHRQHTLGVKVADCLPVYLFNEGQICIIHCGWRSIVKGIARKAAKLLGQYHYVLGASIGPCCYSIGEDVAVLFQQKYKNAITLRNGKYYLDLKAAVIEDLGEEYKLAALDFCTKCTPQYFYSYRRGDHDKRNVALLSYIDVR